MVEVTRLASSSSASIVEKTQQVYTAVSEPFSESEEDG